MDLSGSRNIAASRRVVWKALNDPDILRASIPGCSELTGNSESGFDAVVTQKIGPVKATFKGQVELSDIVAKESYKISGQGKGGPAGYAKGGATVTLSDTQGGTQIAYVVSAQVGGKIASLGARLIDGVAKKNADQFFENFQSAVEGVAAEPTISETTDPATTGMIGKYFNWLKGFFS